jgi:hypothetical protein
VPLKAMYTTSMLAKALGIGRARLHRLLKGQQVLVYIDGTRWLVPLSEIEEKLPAVWESIRKAEKERGAENSSVHVVQMDRLPPL